MERTTDQRRLGQDTLKWIEAHPELIGHLERLREVSEDAHRDFETLEAAERAVIQEINRLGGEALKGWMSRREAEASEQMAQRKGVRKHSKKNFG